jgi:hypothetical protein
VIIDIQGVADVKNITFNGIVEQFAANKNDHRHGASHKHGHHGVKDHHSDNEK